MLAQDIIIKPLLTEKGYDGIRPVEAGERITDKKTCGKKYSFVVAKSASKTQIKDAVEKLFGVEVERVNTANYKGKLKRMGRYEGYTPAYKKAIVQLKADSKTIEFFDSLS